MDWVASKDGIAEALGPDRARWVIRPAESVQDQFALFRLPAGTTMPSEPDDEMSACAILRSVGEARIMAGLLVGSAGKILFIPEAFEKTYDGEGGRRNFRLPFADGYVSLHWGTDESIRDVVATRFSRRSPGRIRPVLILSHGYDANMPEGASPMPAAVALLELIHGANRFDSPLDEDDARLWSQGEPVRAVGHDDASDILGTDPEIAAAAMALDEAGIPHEHLLEAALEIVGKGTEPGATPGRDEAVTRSLAIQYVLVAKVRGKDVADALVEASARPAP